jgi:hypothetical protein
MATVPSDLESNQSSNLRVAWKRWFQAPYRLPILHTALNLAVMLGLYWDWTDFSAQPYDCVYLPYVFISGPIVYGMGHVAMHYVDPLLSVDDIQTIRIAWNLIPGFFCLTLGGIQWWLIEMLYIRVR